MILFKKKSIKFLLWGKLNISGRNNNGRLVFYSRGGGCKKTYRLIDYNKYLWNILCLLLRFEYDPSRRILLSLVCYSNGVLSYGLSTQGTYIGYLFFPSVSKDAIINVGEVTQLAWFKSGFRLHSLECTKFRGAQYARSKGTFLKILTSKILDKSILKLSSKILILIPDTYIATKGMVSKLTLKTNIYRKASFF